MEGNGMSGNVEWPQMPLRACVQGDFYMCFVSTALTTPPNDFPWTGSLDDENGADFDPNPKPERRVGLAGSGCAVYVLSVVLGEFWLQSKAEIRGPTF